MTDLNNGQDTQNATRADPMMGYIGVAEDNSMWLVREVRGDIPVAYLTRVTSVDVIHMPRTDDHTPEADSAAVLAADGTGWKIQNRSGDNLCIRFGTVNVMMRPPLPKRVPGQSLTDAYAEQVTAENAEMRRKANSFDEGLTLLARVEQVTAEKAQRYDEAHARLHSLYLGTVEVNQFYTQRVYAELIYVLETGRNPADDPSAVDEFKKHLYGTAIQTLKQRR